MTGHTHSKSVANVQSLLAAAHAANQCGVERCNGAWRYEFYACNDLPGTVLELNPRIDDWQESYNFIRPHGALSGLTPAKYLTSGPIYDKREGW